MHAKYDSVKDQQELANAFKALPLQTFMRRSIFEIEEGEIIIERPVWKSTLAKGNEVAHKCFKKNN